jgi:WD40 repeat protein/serine/threonine protein kinase
MAGSITDVKSIFGKALEIACPDEREAYLAQVCGGDPRLRAEVESLLQAGQSAGGFFADLRLLPGPTIDQFVSERPGDVIGAYKLLEPIGEGGFGLVFVAEQQQPVRRRVALKVLKPGMDSRQVVARFEAERQALALMDHPNIARVYDGGETPSGRPYFVMELVKGVPITDFCDQNQLTPRQRLELFVSVCQAVQHAHQKGIIHRDLKPNNVLVSRHDTTPVVKVIDFGVAKALGQELTDKTMFTGVAQMVGTPLYMSPEQAGMSDLDVDTRSDIYSLGVLLYELLTGTTPFTRERFKIAGYDEIRRIIREEEPPKPSTRLSTLVLTATTASPNRRTELRRLSTLVRGDLDWIVMKALEKDRNRRYETASAFAADVQRYLADEPVQACPPSAAYRLRKFARRNRRGVVTATALALAVLVTVAGLSTSTVLIARALRSETEAKGQLDDTLKRERVDAYFQRITLAHSALSADNLAATLKYLADCPHDLRDWEWLYLQRLCKYEPVTLPGRGNGVRGVAVSPDGRRLAAANEDGTVGLFDMQTGAELPPLRGHTALVFSVAFSPDGRHLGSAAADRTVRLWDLTTGTEVFPPRPGHMGSHGSASYGVAFSPDGRRLAAGDSDGSLVVWDAADGRELLRLHGHERMALCVAYSPEGLLLATGSWAGVLRLWDAASGQLLRTVEVDSRPLSAAVFSRDGRWLATTGYDRQVRLWDVAALATNDGMTPQPARAWRAHDCLILGLAFTPDGRRLASIGGEDKAVKIWDPVTGREVLTLRGHTFTGQCVAFSPDGRRLVSSGLDRTIRVWDATPLDPNDREELLTLPHDDEVWNVAFSPDGRQIASASFDRTARMWDAATGTLIHRLSHPVQVLLLSFDPDGKRLATTSRDKTVRVWDTATGLQLHDFRSPNEFLYGLTFSPDGRHLLVDDVGGKQGKPGENHTIKVWDAQTGDDAGIVGRHRLQTWGLAFGPDGGRLLSASNDGTVKVWRWDPARLDQPQNALVTLRVQLIGFANSAAFTPDGRHVVTAAEEHTVKVWDAADGRLLNSLAGHTGDVYAVALSRDGRWLATAGEDTTVRVWDAKSWELRHTFRGHTGLVMSLAFSPDSQRLVSGSRDGTVKVWDRARWEKVRGR